MITTRDFFEELFEQKPHDNLISIFSLPSRAVEFFKNIDNAAMYVDAQKKKDQNIYFCTNFLSKRPAKGRGQAEDSGGVSCLYMDVDINATQNAHVKSDYPGSETEAISLLNGYGFDPSLIIHSGYGLHAYWLFKEPWTFTNDTERDTYHTLLQRLQATIKIRAAKSGWRLDSTADLARVLRVPGTYNIKIPTNPVEVKVINKKTDSNGLTQRYNPADIEQFLVDDTTFKKTKLSGELKAQVYNDIVLVGNAEPPQEKLEQLCEIEEKFAASWKAKRQEFGDDPSRYAQSLANFAARANWTKQEIANLLIAFYRKNLDNPLFTNRPGKEPIALERIMRISKLGTTIGKAIQSANEETAKKYEEEIDPADAAGLSDMVDPDGSRALQYASSKLRLPIERITRYIPEEGKDRFYEMEIKRAEETLKVTFENSNEMFNQSNFKLRIIDGVNIVPKSVDKESWAKVCDAFTKIIHDVKVSPSTETIEGKMQSWIEQYLENKPVLTPLQAYRGNQPFVKKGYWYIFTKPFSDWCWTNKGWIEGMSKIQVSLKRVGAEEKRHNEAYEDNKNERVYFRAWRIPHAIAIPPPTMVVNNTRIKKESADDEPLERVMPVS